MTPTREDAEFCKETRKANGWTQHQMADVLHTSRSSVSHLENGHDVPDEVLAELRTMSGGGAPAQDVEQQPATVADVEDVSKKAFFLFRRARKIGVEDAVTSLQGAMFIVERDRVTSEVVRAYPHKRADPSLLNNLQQSTRSLFRSCVDHILHGTPIQGPSKRPRRKKPEAEAAAAAPEAQAPVEDTCTGAPDVAGDEAPNEEPDEVGDEPRYSNGAIVHVVDGWELVVHPEDKPRMLDVELGKHLGFARPRAIRGLIERHEAKLGEWVRRHTVWRGVEFRAEYHVYELTLEGALFITAKCETEIADDVLKDMARVYAEVTVRCSGGGATTQDARLTETLILLVQQQDSRLERIENTLVSWAERDKGKLWVHEGEVKSSKICRALHDRYGKEGPLAVGSELSYKKLTFSELMLLVSRAGLHSEVIRVRNLSGDDRYFNEWPEPLLNALIPHVQRWYEIGTPKVKTCAWRYNDGGVGRSRESACYDWNDDDLVPRLLAMGYQRSDLPNLLWTVHNNPPPAKRDTPYALPADLAAVQAGTQ